MRISMRRRERTAPCCRKCLVRMCSRSSTNTLTPSGVVDNGNDENEDADSRDAGTVVDSGKVDGDEGTESGEEEAEEAEEAGDDEHGG